VAGEKGDAFTRGVAEQKIPVPKKKLPGTGYYTQQSKTGAPKNIRVSGNKNFGTEAGYLDISWAGQMMADEIGQALAEALEPFILKIEADAEAAVHVSPVTKPVYESGPNKGKSFTARKPGTLKHAHSSYTAERKDKTAMVGSVQFGDPEIADYAFEEELGVPGKKGGSRSGHAYLRPAFNKHAPAAVEAMAKAIEHFKTGLE
jgi:hypothetical protein